MRLVPGRYRSWALASLVGFAACRSHSGFQEQYRQSIKPAIERGQWSAAATSIEEARGDLYKEEDRVVFWLDHGTALHYAGQYEESSAAFFKAEETMQDLWTKSISEEVGKFVVSETIQTYSGEDYERILTYLYTALNAAYRGKLSDAVVEARRADQFLQKMRVEYEKKEGLGTIYTQDAFILWLIGLFLEMEGSFGDAYLAYSDAYRAYEKVYSDMFGASTPPYLVEDLYRSASLAGRDDEADKWAEPDAGQGTVENYREGRAELIIVHGNGEAPFKKELSFTAVIPDGIAVRVAVPELVPRPTRVAASLLSVGDQTIRSVLAEPVAKIATRNFKKRLPGIKARAVARAAVKYAATKVASEAVKGDRKDRGRNLAGFLVGVVGGIASAAAEGADLRAWSLLPSEFRVARAWVYPGKHPVSVELVDSAGRSMGVALSTTVTLKARERRILSLRSIR